MSQPSVHSSLRGVPRGQKMLQGHLSRVMYHWVYLACEDYGFEVHAVRSCRLMVPLDPPLVTCAVTILFHTMWQALSKRATPSSSLVWHHLNLRTTSSQKCEAVPRRARIKTRRLVYHSTPGTRVVKMKKKHFSAHLNERMH